MSATVLVIDLAVWYYSRAILDVLSVWFNLMWFLTHFFSMPLLLRTLFSPWKRMTDDGAARDVEAFLEAAVMNVMSRVFGAVARLSLICIGTIALCIGVLFLGVSLLLWMCLPFLLVYSFVYGASLFV
jgi:hypothetical protein